MKALCGSSDLFAIKAKTECLPQFITYNSMKSLYSSKTFWLAVVQALIGVIVAFSTAYPALGGLVIAKSIADIILRIVTDTAVTA